ncbi:phosphatidate cytidylyltransferase [Azovibrio restrictus]|uniref:phosphatidate cytidylyltransferase n=1 Tax=Azovibrio restrictus TaxID=146938 RepID=UPI0026EC7DA6|nr:phosphatidate cytidylyltransferase [Azovibrio restrictus]
MLKERGLTAVLMLLVLVPAMLWLPQAGWALFTAAIIAIGGWEWGALAGFPERLRKLYGAFLFILMLALLFFLPGLAHWPDAGLSPFLLAVYGAASLFWLILVPLWLRQRWPCRGGGGALLGLMVLLPAWLAAVQFRDQGVPVLLAVLSLAWVADIAAYFSGRAFGRHKLAPSISPGKTWEGVAGAVLGVLVLGLLAGPRGDVGIVTWAALLVLLTAVSVVGDLFESLLKRQAGIKDSSALLPGHGGVLDRIDSLTAVLPVWACFFLLTSA